MKGEKMEHERVAWGPTIAWVLIILASLAFWAGVGYGISRAFAADPKPDPPHIVCDESAPRPHIGTAIVCFTQP
jgi:hypothetical protein